jgi:hypothetical protein
MIQICTRCSLKVFSWKTLPSVLYLVNATWQSAKSSANASTEKGIAAGKTDWAKKRQIQHLALLKSAWLLRGLREWQVALRDVFVRSPRTRARTYSFLWQSTLYVHFITSEQNILGFVAHNTQLSSPHGITESQFA